MKRQSTWASQLTVLTSSALALLLLERLVHVDRTSSAVLVGALAVGGLLAALKMALHNCFESHLLVAFVAGATMLGTLLSLTLGLPGADRSPLTAVHALLIVLPVASLALQNADRHLRRSVQGHRMTSPYAS